MNSSRSPHIYILLSAICFTAMAGNMKALSHLSPFFIVGIRQIILSIGIVLSMPNVIKKIRLDTKQSIYDYVLRASISFIALILTCWGLSYVSLVEAKIIGLSETILVAIISIIFIRNKIRKIEWVLLSIPVVGGALTLFNGMTIGDWLGYPIIFLATVGYALSAILSRRISEYHSPFHQFIVYTMLSAFIGLPLMILYRPVDLALTDVLLLLMVAMWGGLGQFFLIKGYSVGNIATSAPFGLASIILAAFIDRWIFDIPMYSADVMGVAILIIGFYMLHRYKRIHG